MNDIVDRLRGQEPLHLGDRSAAADVIERLRAELETERMRLAACSAISLANTPESAASARELHPDYQSPSCDDVARAVDREIAIRAELAECKQDAERYRYLRSNWTHGTSVFMNNLEFSLSETLDHDIDAALAAEGEAK